MNELTHLLADAPVPYAFPLPWRVITMFFFFGSFAFALGAAVLHVLVVRPALKARPQETADNAVLRGRSATVMSWAGLLYFLSLYPQLAGKVARANKGMAFSQGLHPGTVWAYLDAPGKGGIPLGVTVLVQFSLWAVGALLLVALALPAVRARIDAVATTAVVALAVASFILSFGGNLSEKAAYDWMSGLVSNVHVTATCTWAGGLMALAFLGATRRRLSPSAGATWAHVWKRFSRVAQVCVATLLCSGLWLAWDAVGTVPMLWRTPFGRFLSLKLLLVLTLVCIGAYNEFVLLPKLARARAARDERGLFALAAAHFPKVVVVEAVLATAVLLVVPFLSGTGREEGGLAPSNLTGGIFAATAVLVVLVAVSFVAGAKVQGGFERRAEQDAAADPSPDAVTPV
jgi:copper transport protein